MENLQPKIWIRVNGIGHAFSRQLGCDCNRCKTINFAMTPPPPTLRPFDGWDDPPWRAHTSASILLPDEEGNVKSHILIDVGAGVVDSLVSSQLRGLENIEAILISHGHPDHVLGLNQLSENLRSAGRRNTEVYCTEETYKDLERGGTRFRRVWGRSLTHRTICPGVTLMHPPVSIRPSGINITALRVAHHSGAVIYIAELGSKKVVFFWDIDVPDAVLTPIGMTNRDIITSHLHIFNDVNLLLIDANTWEAGMTSGTPTGHTSYVRALEYKHLIDPEKTYLVHLSGHEDGPGRPGYGWTDSEWEAAVSPGGVLIARQGMLIGV